mgnify:CR=1 FL=1
MLRAFALIAAILGLFGAWYFVLPTGKPEKDYPVSGFTNIEVSNGVWVKVYTGQEGGVQARALRGDIDDLIVEKRGNTLAISVKEAKGVFGPWMNNRYQVTIWASNLRSVTTDHEASLEVVSGLHGSLSVAAHDGSNLLISEIYGSDISVQATGEGSVTLYGVCNRIRAMADTGGTIGASGMECLTADADARGEGTVEIRAMETADLNALAGKIVLTGSATVGRSREMLGGEIVRR